jgi:ArsR family transcriptional regulator
MKDILKLFKALSDSTRLRIMMLLMRRDLCVCELMFILKMEQSRISHQLRILRDADLVEDKRRGRWIVYEIPGDVRKNLMPPFSRLVKDEAAAHEQFRRDLKALQTCLKEEIRLKGGPKGRIRRAVADER